jgi:hypothetical protein
VFTRGQPSIDNDAAYAPVTIVSGSAGQQVFAPAGPVSPAALHAPQYSPLNAVAYPAFDELHRDWTNLFHPLPPTAASAPAPDANPFATLRNWGMQAVAGLRVTVFGRPQSPSLKGSGGY